MFGIFKKNLENTLKSSEYNDLFEKIRTNDIKIKAIELEMESLRDKVLRKIQQKREKADETQQIPPNLDGLPRIGINEHLPK